MHVVLGRRRMAALGLGLLAASRAPSAFGQGKPRYGGHLRVAYNLEPTSLNPMVGRSGGDMYYLRGMFDPLVNTNQQGLPDASTSLATAWEVQEEPPALVLTLREGVRFHDGTPFDAEAVKFNIETIQDPATKATPRSSLAPVASVDVLGPHKVRLNLKGPWAPAFGTLYDRAGLVNSPTAMRKLGLDYGWNPCGTGPFRIKEVVTGSHVHMVRNEEYWGKDKDGNRLPYLDEVTVKVIKDDKVLSSALRSGEVDVAYLPTREVDGFMANPAFQVTRTEGGAVGPLLVFNPDVAPMDNLDLRRAVAQAINPADINKAVFFNKHTIAEGGMWPVTTWGYAPSASRAGYGVDGARKSLAAGGKPSGFEISVITWDNPDLQRSAEVVRAQLGRVGIKASINVETVNSATERFFAGKAIPLFLTTWSRYAEPDYFASTALKSGGYYNPSSKPNATMDELIAAGAANYDQEERKRIYHRLNDYVLANSLWHPLLYMSYYPAAPKKVQNLDTLVGSDGKMVYKDIWMSQG